MARTAHFSSLGHTGELRDHVLRALSVAEFRAKTSLIDVHIMMFSFTDPLIASTLRRLSEHRNIRVRIIVDWSQFSCLHGHQAPILADENRSSLEVRFKKDQPYRWDPETGRLHWSYHISRGMLHHKTMCIVEDGFPLLLLCGSYNWTAAGRKGYENLVTFGRGDPDDQEIMRCFELEFACLWCDGDATLCVEAARRHHALIAAEFRLNPSAPPQCVRGVQGATGGAAPASRGQVRHEVRNEVQRDAYVAFNSRRCEDSESDFGYSQANCQRIVILGVEGRLRSLAVSISSVLRLQILQARKGAILRLAMFAMSNRVSEYNVLLSAARRGCNVRAIFSRENGRAACLMLEEAARRGAVDISTRIADKRMHQKYCILDDVGVTFGSANMTTDSHCRHTEHRVSVWGDRPFAAAFIDDFEHMWQHALAPG